VAEPAGLRAAFGFPIRLGGEIFGVMEFFSREAETPDDILVEVLSGVGSQIGQFIERTRAEEQLCQTTVDLQRSNTDLQQFAYVASHDLTEPLRMVTSYLQLLTSRCGKNLDAQAREFIGFAVDGAKRMQALIHDLLTYSRVDLRGRSLEATDLEEVFRTAKNNLKVAIEESGAVITHEPLPRVLADSIQLTQLFQNLLGNGIKFHGREAPLLSVSAQADGEEWVFSVRDNGIGIDPRDFERLFVIFQRLHTRQEYAGTGMGLAICKKILERHGGRIWVESAPGKGSTFFFTLPMLKAD
jgi:light-regulated signal transduction histidine kinase (bacteriophytochrome)